MRHIVTALVQKFKNILRFILVYTHTHTYHRDRPIWLSKAVPVIHSLFATKRNSSFRLFVSQSIMITSEKHNKNCCNFCFLHSFLLREREEEFSFFYLFIQLHLVPDIMEDILSTLEEKKCVSKVCGQNFSQKHRFKIVLEQKIRTNEIVLFIWRHIRKRRLSKISFFASFFR